jgi:hypothetical protein
LIRLRIRIFLHLAHDVIILILGNFSDNEFLFFDGTDRFFVKFEFLPDFVILSGK